MPRHSYGIPRSLRVSFNTHSRETVCRVTLAMCADFSFNTPLWGLTSWNRDGGCRGSFQHPFHGKLGSDNKCINLFNPSSFNTPFMGNDYRRPQTLSQLHSSNTLFVGNNGLSMFLPAWSFSFFQHPFRGKLEGFLGHSPSYRRAFNTLFVGNRAQLPNFLLLQRLLPSHFFKTKIFLRFI
jgi:hypothetical protein